ncbi:hypothetical protein THAOC_25707, partial [Thalassiosira oceanica]
CRATQDPGQAELTTTRGERAAGLDQKYVPEVVGDGTNGQVGPFEAALVGDFYTDNVFPIVVGTFGEVNEDTSKLITKLARLTAKTDFGKSMSPLVVTSQPHADVVKSTAACGFIEVAL